MGDTNAMAWDAASAVLTNRTLFTLTVSFQNGLPQFAIDFAHRHAALVAKYWQGSGVLPSIAIATEDLGMLERFYGLYEQQCEYQRRFRGTAPDPRLAFDSTMTYAAEEGKLKALRWLHDHTNVQCDPKTLAFAATMGRFDIVQWLAANRKDACVSLMTSPCDAVVLTGNTELIQFIVTHFPSLQLTTDAMDFAAAHGYTEIVQYLHATRGEGCTSDAMDHAARCGRLDLVQFLHEHRHEGCTTNAMDFAAANGHLKVVQYLHTHRTEGCTTAAMDEAARNGHVDVVAFLHSQRTEGCTTFAMDMAAAKCHVESVRFLHAHRREGCTPLAMIAAAEAGHLDVVRFLHEVDADDFNCSGDALHAAARCGRVQVLKFLVGHCSRGCLVTARDEAAAMGHKTTLAVLQEFIEDGAQGCSERDHALGAKHRRCQKPSTEAARAW